MVSLLCNQQDPSHLHLSPLFTTVIPSNPLVPKAIDTLKAGLLYLMLSFTFPLAIKGKHLHAG